MINKKPPSRIVWSAKTITCPPLHPCFTLPCNLWQIESHIIWAFNQFKNIVDIEVTRSSNEPNIHIECGKQLKDINDGDASSYIMTENATMAFIELFDNHRNSLLGGIAKFLGLAPSTSQESVFNDRNRDALSEDDIAGIKALYQRFSSRSNIDYHFHQDKVALRTD